MNHYTSIEQSKKLVELGLNPDTADMQYLKLIRENDTVYIPELLLNDNECDLPCWSLGALINLMPSTIYKDGETITLTIYKDVVYHYFVCYTSHYHLDEIWFSKENLLDSVFEMVCWLLKNGYIKKGE